MNSEQFEKYQQFTETTIHNLSQQVTELEKKLDMFTNLLEISRYINQYIKVPNLFSLINDMLIGVFGAKHSSIYIKMKEDYYEASNQKSSDQNIIEEKKLIFENNEDEFIINSNKTLLMLGGGEDVHSCLGVPVRVDNRLIGFIIIQHKECDYFTKEHAMFLSLIGNHIGVAIENNFLYKQITESANRDGLTDIFNKRYFFDTLKQITGLPEQNYSIVIFDLDNFKKINDNYGHPVGDAVLKTVAAIIKMDTRVNDIVARYGGDEFILYLSNFTNRDEVIRRVETIREKIETTIIRHENVLLSATASFGVYIKENEVLTLDEVIQKADENMYRSKNNGKNIVSI